MRWAGVILGLLLATPAHAAVEFFSSLDHCSADPTTDTNLWTTIQGAPSLVASSLDSDPGNRCAYGMSPASGSALYVAKTTACGATCYAGFRVKFTSCPTTRRRLVTFRDTGGSKDGALLTVEADPAAPTTRCILKAFYESEDLTGGECSASATMDGTECGGACTTVADCVNYARADVACTSNVCRNECDAANADVGSSCLPGIYAQITVPVNSWRMVTLGQVNSTGAAQVLLSEGTSGSAVQRGAQTRSQGECSAGSTVPGKVCTVDGDCPSGTCATTDVVTIEEIRWGTDDTRTGAFAYVLDSPWIDTATAQTNVQVQTFNATAQDQADGATNWNDLGTAHGCGGGTEWACVNDSTSPDDNSSAIINQNAADPVIDIQVATPNPTPTPLAFAALALAQDAASGGSNATTAEMEFFQNGSANVTAVYGEYFFDDNPGTGGGSDPYYLMPQLFSTTAPDGSAWSYTDIAAMRLRFNKTAGSGNEGRVTQLAVSGLFRLPDPPVPTVIPDRNRNGVKTVCFIGDSTWNQATFHNALTANLLEPDNIIECAEDGGRIADATRDISIAGAGNDMLETAGTLSSVWTCRALKGSLGDTCDVVFVSLYANTSAIGSLAADPAVETDHEGLGTGLGYCDDNGGADQGNVCSCPIHSDPTIRPVFPHQFYCRVRGSKWKASAVQGFGTDGLLQQFGCFCNTNADCKLTSGASDGTCAAIPTPTAPAATRTPGNPTPKVCATPGIRANNSKITDDPPNTWYLPGCLNAPGCTNGLCLQAPNEAYLVAQRDSIQAAVAARPTNTGTLVTPTPPAPTPPAATAIPKVPLLGWVAPFPPLQHARTGVDPGSSFPSAFQKTGTARDELIARANAASLPMVDLGARLLRDCPGKRLADYDKDGTPDGSYLGETLCLKDGVHTSDVGDVIQAQALIDCLTNAYGTSDGLCGPSPTPPLPTPGQRRCTQGKVSDNCSANADCDTYRCNFAP